MAIMLPAAARGSWKIPAGRTAAGKRRAKKAMEDQMTLATSILAKVLHPSLFVRNITIAETKELRASCGTRLGWDPVKRQWAAVGFEISANEASPIRTLIHEACHAVESTSDVYEAMVAFRDKRTAGESLKKLSVLYPMMGYDPGEVTYEDKWAVRGGSHYTGKKYPDDWRATEVFTKGMERLIFETAEFAADDPEYFEVILKAAQKLP